jgi:xylitol oxidase
MKRKTFIRLSSGAIAAPLLSPISGWTQKDKLRNWAGNVEFSTSNVFYPASVQELQQLIKEKKIIRALGTKHCFNRIADSKYNLISSAAMNKVVALDEKAQQVTVEGGIKYGELCPILDSKGFALHNLASLPHISVAGSISTGTHGSGVTNGNLSTAVSALEIIRADGGIMHLSHDNNDRDFPASVVGLGAIGWISKVTLNVQPRYDMQQFVYENLPLDQLKANFDKIISSGYSVSLFTDWQNESINEVWIKNRIQKGSDNRGVSDFFGARPATKNMHPIASLSAENCTEQLGVPGPWYERLPHFKMGFTPSSGKELQSEYFIPHRNAMDAILAIQKLGKRISPHLFISEIRSIAADNLWLSPCYHQDSVTIHFTWKQEWDQVKILLPLIEKELAPFKARPHWGKLFTISPQVLASCYEKMDDFKRIILSDDPTGKFRNDFIDTYIMQT